MVGAYPCGRPVVVVLAISKKTIVNVYTIWHHGIILLPEESKALLNEAKKLFIRGVADDEKDPGYG
jgi:hypothetical protein